MSIQVSIRKAKCLDLKAYCVFAKEHDFIEVTEWINGEGYDVTISNAGGVINKTSAYKARADQVLLSRGKSKDGKIFKSGSSEKEILSILNSL